MIENQTKYRLIEGVSFTIVFLKIKKCLKDYDIEMNSIHNEGKTVIAERVIGNLKTKIYKYMTSTSKNVYIDKLDNIVNEYNNTCHRTIKMKSLDVKDDTHIDWMELHSGELRSTELHSNKDPKFKAGEKEIKKFKIQKHFC